MQKFNYINKIYQIYQYQSFINNINYSYFLLKLRLKYMVLWHNRTESSGGGLSAEAAVALVSQLFPSAILEENFAERLVFSVPQSAVSSLARCFQQIEDGKTTFVSL